MDSINMSDNLIVCDMETTKQCYSCDAPLYGSKPERINPNADDDEVNNELCYRCYTEAVQHYAEEENDRKWRYRQAWGVCEDHPNCECCTPV